MTTKELTSVKALEKEIATVAAEEYLVETNEGTFGATEAHRAVGTGDPAFATRRVWETVGGERRETGPDADTQPGRTRVLNRDTVAARRKHLSDLRAKLRAAKR